MSVAHAQSPDISDINPVTVAETLSVTTDSPTGPTIVTVSQPQTLVNVPAADTQTVVPSVGASISVPDSGPAGAISERSSSALLNLASNSLSLTEILSAQQQALEQFQCQLQLAQQTEAINQRLDAIERTLNSLIQQKVQEDAAKSQQSTPVRPSQQVHLQTTPELSGDGLDMDILKRKKLPRELCVSVLKYKREWERDYGVPFVSKLRFLVMFIKPATFTEHRSISTRNGNPLTFAKH